MRKAQQCAFAERNQTFVYAPLNMRNFRLSYRYRALALPAPVMGHLSDDALLVHIRAVHAQTRGAYGWPRIWRALLVGAGRKLTR